MLYQSWSDLLGKFGLLLGKKKNISTCPTSGEGFRRCLSMSIKNDLEALQSKSIEYC